MTKEKLMEKLNLTTTELNEEELYKLYREQQLEKVKAQAKEEISKNGSYVIYLYQDKKINRKWYTYETIYTCYDVCQLDEIYLEGVRKNGYQTHWHYHLGLMNDLYNALDEESLHYGYTPEEEFAILEEIELEWKYEHKTVPFISHLYL